MPSFRHTRAMFNKAATSIPPRSANRPSAMQQGPEVEPPGMADSLLFLRRQVSGGMRLRAGQSIIELALLSRSGATSWATNCQGLLVLGSHDHIMQYRPLIML